MTEVSLSGLVIDDLHAGYGVTPVLRGIELTVAAGTIAAVLGPSGCGKTTLLRAVAGFVRAEAGRIELHGRVLTDVARSTNVAPERRRIGLVPQEGALFPHLSVAGNIGFGLARTPQRRQIVEQWIERVGLGGLGAARPHELSGGQQQRVALARALAPQPDMVLLDEPFSSLDAALRTHLRDEVARVLRATSTTVLLVTHDQDEALSMADQVAVMLDGAFAQRGDPRTVYERPVDLSVATFVGAANVLRGVVHDGVATCRLGRFPVTHRGADGPAEIVVRPEWLTLTAAESEPIVFEIAYHGGEAMVRARYSDGTVVTARTDGATPLSPGAAVAVVVNRPAVSYAIPLPQ